MSVNIFGKAAGEGGAKGARGTPGVGFKILDTQGNFDIDYKRLAKVAWPESDSDATTKKYVDDIESELDSQIQTVENSNKNLHVRLSNYEGKHDELEKEVLNVRIDNAHLVTLKHDELKEEITKLRIDNAHLVTLKHDELKEEITELRTYIDELIGGIRTALQRFRTSLSEVNTELISQSRDIERFRTSLSEVNTEMISQSQDVVTYIQELSNFKIHVDKNQRSIDARIEGINKSDKSFRDNTAVMIKSLDDAVTTLTNRVNSLVTSKIHNTLYSSAEAPPVEVVPLRVSSRPSTP